MKTAVHRNYIKEHLSYEASLLCSLTPTYIAAILTKTTAAARRFLPQSNMGTIDTVANNLYIAPSASHGPPSTTVSQISVGTATGHVERLSETTTPPIPQLAADFPTTEYIM